VEGRRYHWVRKDIGLTAKNPNMTGARKKGPAILLSKGSLKKEKGGPEDRFPQQKRGGGHLTGSKGVKIIKEGTQSQK